ncbi:MAG TPA: DUF5305 family protein [Candidatus Thermoplasmatota archaeon]|nr:DUF5305 family protein [Candidatus Thermoplasmatota archaeon]
MSAILRLLRDHGPAASAVAAAMLVVGVLLAQQSFQAETSTRVVEERELWTERASFVYTVPVTRNDTLWPNGTVLPMGEPAYYRTVSSHVPVTFRWEAAAPSGVDGLAHASLALRFRADAKDGRAYWDVVHPLDDAVSAGARVDLAGVVDLDFLVSELRSLAVTMPPGEGKINVSIEATVAYAVATDAAHRSGKAVYRMPVTVQDPRIVLPNAAQATWSKSHVEATSFRLAKPAGWAGVFGNLPALALAVLGVAGLVASVVANESDPARGRTPREAAFLRACEEHADWITTSLAAIDPIRFGTPIVDVPEVEDVVRAAADGRTRVLADARTLVFYAALPNLTLRCSRFAEPAGRREARNGKNGPSDAPKPR